MGALQMRPYQQQAREAIHAQWEEGRQRTLLVLPTGTGKTIVFAAVTEDQVRGGDRVGPDRHGPLAEPDQLYAV